MSRNKKQGFASVKYFHLAVKSPHQFTCKLPAGSHKLKNWQDYCNYPDTINRLLIEF
jgi:hypothetical protein